MLHKRGVSQYYSGTNMNYEGPCMIVPASRSGRASWNRCEVTGLVAVSLIHMYMYMYVCVRQGESEGRREGERREGRRKG